ncbi:MAG: c-type cytochrome domain-containing protein [Prosthecobacter sp.]|uniref:c-type cytochrome domain-containing protein n=1 Tax=Prosthecobacter sp. TaxID=1965333 RepID=UPI003BB1504D
MKLQVFAALLALLGLPSCMQMEPPHEVDFVTEEKPLLETRCLECHQHHYLCAGLNLETQKLAMKGGRSGPVIVPGAPHHSLLYKVLLLGHESPVAMPPTPERLEREHSRLLHDWIRQGAKWPPAVRLVPPQEWKSTPS